VVLLEIGANATRRYQKVYAKDLILNRGVDNLIEFVFINQEQKPVDITGKEITCRLINYNGKELMLQKALEPILPLTGISGLRVSAAELQYIDQQLCYYSLEIPVGSFDYPVFVDAQSGARGVVRIVNSVLPAFVDSYNITIPSHPNPTSGDPKTYYSSVYYSNDSDFFTFQMTFERFTGSTVLQGSTTENFTYWYDIGSIETYTDYSEVKMHNVDGFHPYLRVKIVNNGTPQTVGSTTLVGDVTSIHVR
jgi:hypothetical protein